MASLYAYTKLDTTALDLFQYYQSKSYSNETSTTFRINVDQHTYVDVTGKSFTFDDQGNPTGGYINSDTLFLDGSASYILKSIVTPQEQVNTFLTDTPASAIRTVLAGTDEIYGSKYNDYIDAFGGGDTINGRGGDDTIVTHAGSNVIDGGTGTDTVVFGFKQSDAAVSHDASGNIVIDGSNGEHDVISNVETFQFTDTTADLGSLFHLNAVYRFFDTHTGDHFYTTSAGEAQQIKASIPFYTYEGVSWATPDKGTGTGTEDVFRFFDTKSGTHFYTADVGERDQVIKSGGTYQYEGVAFEAYADPDSAGTGGITLERFFDTKTGAHHMAANAAEAYGIAHGAAGPGWVDEGATFTVHAPTDGMLQV